MTSPFGKQLRKLRKRSFNCSENTKKALTQSIFAKQLNKLVGLLYSDATVSNWERGKHKINHEDRILLVGIIKVLFKCGGLDSVEEANQLLSSGSYGSLTSEEIEGINPSWLNNNDRNVSPSIAPSMAMQLASLPVFGELVGMEATIMNVVHHLGKSVGRRHVVITGRKGIGKSAVAYAVARRFVETTTFTQLVWLTVEKDVNLIRALATDLGEKLGLISMRTFTAKLQLYQLNIALQHTRSLIIIDGIKTESDLTAILDFIGQLLPPTRILLTTRIAPLAKASDNVSVIPLPELNATDTKTFLQQHNPSLTPEHCTIIYTQLGGHPETLQLLVTYSRKWPINRILSAFEQMQEGAIERHLNKIYAEVWVKTSSETQHLVRLLCFVSIKGVSEEMLRVAGQFSNKQFWAAIEEAEQLGLLHAHGTPDTFWYSIHHLTRQFIFAQDEQLHEEALVVIKYWQRRFDVLDSSEWHLLGNERHNIFCAFQLSLQVANNSPSLQQALYSFVLTLYRFVKQQGFINRWLPIHKALTNVTWLNDRQRAVRLNQLGTLYRQQQQFDDAIDMHNQAAKLARKVLDILLSARIDYNLAIANRRAYCYDKAVIYAKKALQQFSIHQPQEVVMVLNLLGTIARHQGTFEEAEAYFRQSLDELKVKSPATIRVRILINLANVLRDQGKLVDAKQKLVEAESLSQSIPTTLHCILWLGQVRLLLVEEKLEEALTILERFDVEKLQQTGQYLYAALILHNRAEVFVQQSYVSKADVALRKAVNIWRLLDDEGRLAMSLNLLGDVSLKRGRSRLAKKFYEEALTLVYPLFTNHYLCEMRSDLKDKINLLNKANKKGV